MRNIRQNLIFAFIYNAAGVPIAAGVLYLVRPHAVASVGRSGVALSSVSVVANALDCAASTASIERARV
jgi:Cu+-exporting ATPase